MKIESQRIRVLDALEPRRQIGSQNRQRAIGPIDVEPEPLAAADGGKSVQVVNRTGVDSASGSHHQERRKARAAIGIGSFLQGGRIDRVAPVDWNQAERIAAENLPLMDYDANSEYRV
jgi:hypothetical protein